jgi:glycosyltransferase involved in cell wall biosynthesis
VEVVITDDPSNAEIEQLVAGRWSSPMVRYFRNRDRLGYPNNFNRALREARGQWFVTLADDDYLLPGALAAVRACIGILGHGHMVFPGPPRRSDQETHGIRYRYYAAGDALHHFQGQPPSAVFFSRELFESLGGYDDRYLASDEELWARYMQICSCMEITSHALAHYRLHDCNLGLNYLNLPDSLQRYDVVSRQLATYRGLCGAELDAFVLARRRTAIRFGLGRGLQLRNCALIRRYAGLMCAFSTGHAVPYAVMAKTPRAAARVYVLYRWLKKVFHFGLSVA